MLSAVLLIPNAAFGEEPPGCNTGTGLILPIISVNPSDKTNDQTDVFVTYSIGNPQVMGEAVSCLAQIGLFGDPQILVNAGTVSDMPGCEFDASLLPADINNNEIVQLWGPDPLNLFGTCEISGNLVPGLNTVTGEGGVGQFILQGSDQPFEQDSTVNAPKVLFDRCIDVVKTGPIKVKLVGGQATVTYDVTVTNCANPLQPSNLDNCRVEDTIAGNQDALIAGEVISLGFPFSFSYDAVISGDTTNEVTVTCDDQTGEDIDDSDTHFVETYTARITVDKSAPPKLPAATPVPYTVKITNDGSSTITSGQGWVPVGP